MIAAHGIDLVSCERLKDMIERHGDHFLERVFTKAERDYCLGRKREMEHLAGRFAVKEAVLKVLGTGWRDGIKWSDIEVVNDKAGKPELTLYGKCKEIADSLGFKKILVSISHIDTHAMASAIAESD